MFDIKKEIHVVPNFIDLEEIGENGELKDFVKDLGFSSRFLYQCINETVNMLKIDNEQVRPEQNAIDIETQPGMEN